MKQTECSGRDKSLTISRGLAMQLEQSGETDHEGKRSMFGQGMHIIAKWDPKVLRSTGRCFEAVFKVASCVRHCPIPVRAVVRANLQRMQEEFIGKP